MIKKDMALIERRKQTGVTAVNEPILSWITVIRSLPCDIQPDRASVVMQEAGQTVMQGKTLFCSPVDIQEKDRYHVVLANPPFGGKERPEVQQNFPIRTGETAYLFLQHFIRKLRAGGRAAGGQGTK